MSERTIARTARVWANRARERNLRLPCQERRHSSRQIAKTLGIRRGQTYVILGALQEKGIVEAIAGKPTKFSGIPLPKALNVLVQAQKQKEQLMERLKPELLSMWETVAPAGTAESQEEKFQFLKGVESIYRKALELIDSSDKQITMVAPEKALYQADRFGVIERMKKAAKRKIAVRMIAEVTPRTKEIATELKEINMRTFVDHSPPHFLIADGKQIIFLTNPMESVDPREANAVWTSSSMLVRTMQSLFENMWSLEKTELGAVTPQLDKMEKATEAEKETMETLREKFADYLAASGFEVKKDYALVGGSGTEYTFSLALFRGNEKPIIMDLQLSSEPISSMRVAEFFAKRLDVEGLISGATLVVRPKLDQEAQKLATFYHVKVTELGENIHSTESMKI